MKFSFIALLFLSISAIQAGLVGSRPNIIFVLTDDQGYGDLSCHGNPVLKTPHLDQMHERSLRFTNWFNSPTCAPTRSALLTGQHEFRNGVTHTIYERERLALSSTTLAQVVKQAGYSTGIFGKWHLGDEAVYQPGKRGFDEVFIHGAGGIGQSYPGSCGDAPGNSYFDPYILHNGTFEHTRGYCTDVFFDQAKKWISTKKDEPFFCWIATNAPHSPYHAKPEDKALYEGKTPNDEAAAFFGMVHNIDENMGKLFTMLKENQLTENTLVIFMNDNGGTAGTPVFNAGMRNSKGTPWLGGTRAISFWHWQGKIAPADCPALTAHLDLFKTVAQLTGATLEAPLQKQSAEGRDLLPLLEKPDAPWSDRYLFTHVGRWEKGSDPEAAKLQNCAVRNQRYTLVSATAKNAKKSKAPAPPQPQGWQLFDVIADPAQSRDLAATNPEVVAQLSAEYDLWWASLKGQYDVHEQAAGPKLNPFAELYWKQYGGSPTEAQLELMSPEKAFAPTKKQ
jgi:arylsulfatase A-like enzyme